MSEQSDTRKAKDYANLLAEQIKGDENFADDMERERICGELEVLLHALKQQQSEEAGIDPNVGAVIAKHRQRAAAGMAKYGVTTSHAGLSKEQWLQHLQEELLDAAVYLQALLAGGNPTADEPPAMESKEAAQHTAWQPHQYETRGQCDCESCTKTKLAAALAEIKAMKRAGDGKNDNDLLDAALAAKREALADAEQWRRLLDIECRDNYETDTNVRNILRPVLGSFVDGDSHGVPPLEDLAERLKQQLAEARKERIGLEILSRYRNQLIAESAYARGMNKSYVSMSLSLEDAAEILEAIPTSESRDEMH